MKPSRLLLLSFSAVLVVLLLGGGLFARVGAADGSYRQAVLFAEVLSMVIENYVDPVDSENLLVGAYEGMLGGLDPNGAFLTPDEVAEWKRERAELEVGVGATVLKSGRALQVIAVEPGSAADGAGIVAGDQIRSIDDYPVRDLSLEQSRRMLRGAPGTEARLELVHPSDNFQREELKLVRTAGRGPAHTLNVMRDIAVLHIASLERLAIDDLETELGDVVSRGARLLLLDLRNLADGDPRDAAALASMLTDAGTLFQLRDRSGRLVESVTVDDREGAWPGSIALLVNGATADGAEALAVLLGARRDAAIYGESTYGLGAEARLYELENGSGLLVPSAIWETDAGVRWNDDGVEPDPVVTGKGKDLAERSADQLEQVLDLLGDAKGEEVAG